MVLLAMTTAITLLAAPPVRAESLQQLTSFESPEQVASVESKDPDRDSFEQSDAGATDGDHALRLFSDGSSSPQRISYTLRGGGSFVRTGWNAYGYFSMDVVNRGSAPAQLGVTMTDTAGNAATAGFRVQPFAYGTVDFIMAYFRVRDVDPDSIETITVTIRREPAGLDMLLDDLRVHDQYPYDEDKARRAGLVVDDLKDRLLPGIEDARRAAADASDHVAGKPTDPVTRALRDEGAGLVGQLSDVADRVEAASTGPELAAGSATYLDLRNLVRRYAIRVAARSEHADASFGVATADSMDLVYPEDLPCKCDVGAGRLELARGEAEATQLVVVPFAAKLTGVRAEVERIVGPGHVDVDHEEFRVTVAPLGFLDVTPTGAYQKAHTYAGWIPDPIRDDLEEVDVNAGTFQPFWLEAHAGTDAVPGRYRVIVALRDADGTVVRQVLHVTVRSVTIPARNALPTMMTTGISQKLEAIYGEMSEDDLRRFVRQWYAFFGKYRIEPDSIYSGGPPYAAVPGTPDPDDLAYLKSVGLLRQFSAYYIDPRVFDLDDPASWDGQIAEMIVTIEQRMAAFAEAGVADHAYIYGFDETRAEYRPLMRKIIDAVTASFPDVPLVTTMYDNSLGTDTGYEEIDIWAPELFRYNREAKERAQMRGDRVYWYPAIASGAPYPNWFNGYPPMDARMLMGVMTYAEGIDGVLYYNIDRWIDAGNLRKLDDGIYSTWQAATFNGTAGDGSLYYPGPDGPMASQRLANVRDGLDDYNLIKELEKVAPKGTADQRAAAERLLAARMLTLGVADHLQDSAVLRQWRSDTFDLIVQIERSD